PAAVITPAAAPRIRAVDVVTGTVAARLIDAGTRSSAAGLRQAAELLRRSRWSDALTAVGSASAPDAQALRGVALIGLERYDDAARVLGERFATGPDDSAVAFVLGWARVASGNPTGAISAFRSAIVAEPGLVPAYLALATTYVDL